MDTYRWMVEQEQDLLYLVEEAYGRNEMEKQSIKHEEEIVLTNILDVIANLERQQRELADQIATLKKAAARLQNNCIITSDK